VIQAAEAVEGTLVRHRGVRRSLGHASRLLMDWAPSWHVPSAKKGLGPKVSAPDRSGRPRRPSSYKAGWTGSRGPGSLDVRRSVIHVEPCERLWDPWFV